MKKIIITAILALILGFIAGFCFRDYYTKQDDSKAPTIETTGKTNSYDTIPHIHHIRENECEDMDCYRCEDFGPF